MLVSVFRNLICNSLARRETEYSRMAEFLIPKALIPKILPKKSENRKSRWWLKKARPFTMNQANMANTGQASNDRFSSQVSDKFSIHVSNLRRERKVLDNKPLDE